MLLKKGSKFILPFSMSNYDLINTLVVIEFFSHSSAVVIKPYATEHMYSVQYIWTHCTMLAQYSSDCKAWIVNRYVTHTSANFNTLS